MRDRPFLSPSEFAQAADELERFAQQSDARRLTVTCQHLDGIVLLAIKRSVVPSSSVELKYREDVEFDELDEVSDPEEAPISPEATTGAIIVDYTVVLSPTYLVPVLYLQIPGVRSTASMLDTLYGRLLPPRLKPQIAGVSVMGAISPTNHPVTDSPCLFVHPCRTADAMRATLPDRPVSGVEYLMLWVGIIGPSVGLYLPTEIAARAQPR